MMQLQSQPVCAVLLILTSISLFFPRHVFPTFGNLAGVHSSYICHYSHFLEAFSRCSSPPQTSVLLHSGCKKEGFRWPSSNAVLGRGWFRQSVTGGLRRRGQTDLEMQICPRASGKGKEPTPMSCSCG